MASAGRMLSLMFGIGGKLNPSLGQATGEAGKQLDEVAKKGKKVTEATKMRDLQNAYKDLGKAGSAVSKSWSGLTSEIMRTGKQAALAIGGLTAASYGLATATATAGDKFYKSAQKIGISTQGFSELAWAAKQSGVEQEALVSSLNKLNKALPTIGTKGGKQVTEAFKAMGISAKDATGNLKSMDALLPEIAKNFAENKNGAQKTAMAMAIFGKSGADLIPFLNQGAAGLDQLRAEARRLGITFDDVSGEASQNFIDSMGEIKAAGQGLVYALGNGLMPILTKLNRDFVAWLTVPAVHEGMSNLDFFRKRVDALAKSFNAWLPDLKKYIKEAAIWIQTSAIRIDEIVQRFGGWESAIIKLVKAWAVWRTMMIGTKFVALLGTIGSLIGAFGAFATSVKAVGSGKAIMSVGALGKALTGLKAGFMGIIGAVKALGVAMMANPMLLILAALGTAIYLIWRNWDDWCKFWGDTMDAILDKWDALCSWIGQKWNAATSYLAELLSPLGDAWAGFVQMNKDLWGAWSDWFGAKCDAMFDWWDSVCESLSAAWNAVCETISSVFTGAIDSILDLPIVQRAIEFGSNFIKGLIEAITGAATAVKNAVLNLLPSLSEVTAKAAEIGGAIKDGIMAPVKGLGNIGRGAADWVFDNVGGLAKGGLVTRPELSWIGEKGPEMVIPLDGSKRAYDLLSETANRLGAVAPRSEPMSSRPSSLEVLGAAAASSTTNIDNRRGGPANFIFNQKVEIKTSGGADDADKIRQTIKDAVGDMDRTFRDLIKNYEYQQARTAMR